MNKIAISYARVDDAFVRRLYDALVAADHEIWVDWEGIPPTAEFLREIESAIADADALLFVISPDSAASETCEREVNWATEFGKRLVPVVCRAAEPASLPEAVRKLNWIPFDSFDTGMEELASALELDLDRVRSHTRLLDLSRQWDRSGYEKSRLLYGSHLGEAERFVEKDRDREPSPTQLMVEFVAASRRSAARKLYQLLIGVAAAFVVAVVLGIIALIQSDRAQSQARLNDAQRQVQEGRAEFVTDPQRGLDLARSGWLAASGEDATVASALERTVRELVAHARLRRVGDDVLDIHASPGGALIAVQNHSLAGELWRADDLEPVTTLRGRLGSAPKAIEPDQTHAACTVITNGGGRYTEIYRTQDGASLGAAPVATLIPRGDPTVAIFDYGGSGVRVKRLSNGAELGRQGLDSYLHYARGWPFFVIFYDDYENTIRVTTSDLFQFEPPRVRDVIPRYFRDLRFPPSAETGLFLMLFDDAAPRLARVDAEKPYAEGIKLDLPPDAPLAFSGDPMARWLLAGTYNETRLIRTGDGAVVDTVLRGLLRVEPIAGRVAWTVRFASEQEDVLVGVVDGQLVERPLGGAAQPADEVPAATTQTPTSRLGGRWDLANDSSVEWIRQRAPHDRSNRDRDDDKERSYETIFRYPGTTDPLITLKLDFELEDAALGPSGRSTHLVLHWVDDEEDRGREDRRTWVVRVADRQHVLSFARHARTWLTSNGSTDLLFVDAVSHKESVGAIYRLGDRKPLVRFDGIVEDVDLGFATTESIVVVTKADGRTELWTVEDVPRRTLDLGHAVAGYHVPAPGHPWVVWYRDGRAYEVAVSWLRDLAVLPSEATSDELVKQVSAVLTLATNRPIRVSPEATALSP